jgi:hypothetical protein
MKENQSQKTVSSPVPAAQDSKGGISIPAPQLSSLQQEAVIDADMPVDEERIPEASWTAIQQKKQLQENVVQQREAPARFSLPAVHHPVLSRGVTVQRVGGLENNANDCFLNAVIQLLERSYTDLFNPDLNKVQDVRVPIQTAMWNIINDLRADKTIPKATVGALRKDLNARGLVADCTSQEDAQELMARIVEYMIGGSVNNYPYQKGHHQLLQGVSTGSEEKDVTGDVALQDYTSDPSGMKEDHPEIGNGLIGIDINIYDSFEDFLYFLYGKGTTTQLGPSEELKVLKDGKQVYVNARTEKRSFLLLPDVITFYVKRFIGNEKIDRNFPMPDTVILVEEPLLSDKKFYKTYTRQVIVRHEGKKTLAGGHYYAVKKEKDGDVKYNDAQKETPGADDASQGSLYSYHLSGVKETLDFGELAWQETRPFGRTTVPDTKGKSLPVSSGNKPSPGSSQVKGGSFYPVLGSSPVPSGKIRGLPNRARDIGLGMGVVDCFINAVLQLIAGSYTGLFDPVVNPRSNPAAMAIQKAVHTLIRKINNEDTAPVQDDEVLTLRKLLLEHKAVSSLFTQEDGGELMMFLINLMTDVSGLDLELPDTDAVVTTQNNTPGALAKAHNVSVEDLVRHNTVLKNRQITTLHREYVEKKDLADPSQAPDELASEDFHYTSWQEETEPGGNVIIVDLGRIKDFDEFLFQRYGQEWEEETFSKSDPAKQSLSVGGKPADVGFSSRLKQQRFTNLPPTLTFLVKRFRSDGEVLKKDKSDYTMPEELILIEEPSDGAKRYKHYELKGIVVHTGKNMEQGHYYTHRKEGREWVKADDQKVWQENSPGADLKTGYIYTYQLKGESDELQPGQHAPQEKYELPATIYMADAKLRPTDAMGFATDPKHRNSQAQNAVSGAINKIIKELFPGLNGVFHAGHLFTSTMGGAGDARNLTPMWGSYNTGDYKVFEDEDLTGLLGELKEDQQLYVKVHAEYAADDSPEQVFQYLLYPADIKKLAMYNTVGPDHFRKQLETAKEAEREALETDAQIATGVQRYYPHLLRTFRRIPLQMYNTEARIITFDEDGAYLSRGRNLAFAIGGSPRALLGAVDWAFFINAPRPGVKLYGGQTAINFAGQDPDEWAVKTYADMPEPGIYNYVSDDGRAAGVDAYIWMDPEGIFSTFKFGGGSTEDAGPAPQGFDWRLLNQASRSKQSRLYARGHLLNGKLHGSGNDPQNLTPLTQDTNLLMSREFEEKVKRLPELTTPGKGIFWISRLSGKIKRSDGFNRALAAKKVAPGTTIRDKEKHELQIALAEEEAKMFHGIHLFAYEAEVQKDGKLKRGRLLLSGYFENRFNGDGDTLGDTYYHSPFPNPLERMLALGRLNDKFKVNLKTEREALRFVGEAAEEEHENAAETYAKQPPQMTDDSPPFSMDSAPNDIQAALDSQLPLYYALYKIHEANVANVIAWNKLIEAYNGKVSALSGLSDPKWLKKYAKVETLRTDLEKRVGQYGNYRSAHQELTEWYNRLIRMAGQFYVLRASRANYGAIKEVTVNSLKDIQPLQLPELVTIRKPRRRQILTDKENGGSGTDPNPRSGKRTKQEAKEKTDSK